MDGPVITNLLYATAPPLGSLSISKNFYRLPAKNKTNSIICNLRIQLNWSGNESPKIVKDLGGVNEIRCLINGVFYLANSYSNFTHAILHSRLPFSLSIIIDA